MGREILFIAHRVPFPPDRGDKIRSHHLLRHLASLAPVHVACLGDDAADMAQESALAALAASHCLVRRAKPLVLAGLEAVARGRPVSLTAFRNARLKAYIDKVLADRNIGTIFLFSGQMGQYVPADWQGRLLFDCVDVDSAKFEAYAATGQGPRRWLHAREARLLRAEEARIAARAEATLLVSAPEAELFAARLPAGSPARVQALGNGIDTALFDPAAVAPAAALLACSGPRMIFTGQMDYPPNVAAARRAIDRLLPAIRARVPGATLHVVGRNPPADLLARHGQEGAFVWGGVPDMRAWLAGADLALVPLELARGIQNKVLESMAMALPVVLTTGAATGIAAQDGAQFAVADGDAELVESCAELLADPARARAMGAAARGFVETTLGWPAVLAPLDKLIDAA